MDVSPVPKTIKARFRSVQDAEQAFNALQEYGFHINNISRITPQSVDYPANVNDDDQVRTGLPGGYNQRDEVIEEAESVLAATDPSRAIGDTVPGLMKNDDCAFITLTSSDDRYTQALDIIKKYGGITG